jgi:hypothetical protein
MKTVISDKGIQALERGETVVPYDVHICSEIIDGKLVTFLGFSDPTVMSYLIYAVDCKLPELAELLIKALEYHVDRAR